MKKVVLVASMYCAVFSTSAQYIPENPNKKVHLGFDLGFNYSNLQTEGSNENGVLNLSNGLGGRLGILADVKLTDNFYLIPQIDLNFVSGNATFVNTDAQEIESEIQESILEFFIPIVYKFKGAKHRPYLIAGPNYRIPLYEKVNDASIVPWNSDLAFDFGIGLENGTKHFLFAPEIRYSYGWKNVRNVSPFPNIYNHSISLIFKFYG